MTGAGTRDLSEAAIRCTPECEGASTTVSGAAEPVAIALDAATQLQGAWVLREGVRLRFVRRITLFMLRPFVERQQSLDGFLTTSVALLADEVLRMREHVSRLEAELEAVRRDEGPR